MYLLSVAACLRYVPVQRVRNFKRNKNFELEPKISCEHLATCSRLLLNSNKHNLDSYINNITLEADMQVVQKRVLCKWCQEHRVCYTCRFALRHTVHVTVVSELTLLYPFGTSPVKHISSFICEHYCFKFRQVVVQKTTTSFSTVT